MRRWYCTATVCYGHCHCVRQPLRYGLVRPRLSCPSVGALEIDVKFFLLICCELICLLRSNWNRSDRKRRTQLGVSTEDMAVIGHVNRAIHSHSKCCDIWPEGQLIFPMIRKVTMYLSDAPVKIRRTVLWWEEENIN